ncbi:hypothetical protein JCM8547_007733 [Rhodosporidiobolus lusitaniae]
MSSSTWPGYAPGYRWTPRSHPLAPDATSHYHRPLNLLEAKFDQATQKKGQSDTFVRLSLSLEGVEEQEGGEEAFLGRLVLAWAAARAKHPLLACMIHDAVGEEEVFPSVQPREFRYFLPASAEDALDGARTTFLVHDAEEGKSLEEAMDEVQSEFVLNGERILLNQGACLARLVLVKNGREKGELGFFLVVSHVISDGLSVFKLVNELFTLSSSLSLPTSPSPPSFCSLAEHLAKRGHVSPWPVTPDTLSAWAVVLHEETLLSRLPLGNEEHYPVIPLPSLASPLSSTPPSSLSNTARQRWYWAIHRVLLKIRFDRFPTTLHVPRLPGPTPPVQARTRWERLRLSKEMSGRLLALCKRRGISPSMLLYSLISLSLSNLLSAAHPTEPYHPVIIGFPFSLRPFLLPSPASPIPASSPSLFSDPSTDLAIRITFSQIHLPSLPYDLSSSDPLERRKIHAAALRGARLAKQQFAENLDPRPRERSRFLATGYALVVQRLLNGAGNNPIPHPEPKTALNASMIGDVDRLLPTSFPLPSLSPTPSSSPSSSPSLLRLSNILIGTRLHNGEGMLLEALTWDGMVTLCLGLDDGLIREETVKSLLEGVEMATEVVVEEEEREEQ